MGIKIKMDSIKTNRFKMDAVNVEVEEGSVEKVEAVLEKVKEAAEVISQLEGENATLQAESDQMTDETTELKKENEELMDEDSERVEKMVEEKKEIEDAADACGIKKEDRKGMKKRDLKVAIIKAKSEKFDAKDKSDDYINARFDMIKEKLAVEDKNNDGIKKFNKDANDGKVIEPKDPRKSFMNRSAELYKNK